MNRAFLTLITVFVVAGVAAPNAGPPRTKVLPVEHKITTEKEYADYNFYLVDEKVVAVKFDPKNPIELKPKAGDKYAYALVALPKDAAKAFQTEDELHQALVKDRKIEGRAQTQIRFGSSFNAFQSDARDKAVQEHKVEKITAKDGIVLKTKTVEASKDAPKKDAPKKDSPEDDAPLAAAPRGRTWVAGLAAALGMTFGGLWLVSRGRRKL
jgi:hypothetical protein